MPHYSAMNSEIAGVQDVIHTWTCQWVIFSVDAGMGRGLIDQGTLERKRTKKQRGNIKIITVFF